MNKNMNITRTDVWVCQRRVVLATKWAANNTVLVTTLNSVVVHTSRPRTTVDALRLGMAEILEHKLALQCVRHCRAESLGELAETINNHLTRVHRG